MKRAGLISLLTVLALGVSCSRKEPLGVIDTRGDIATEATVTSPPPDVSGWPASQRVFVVGDRAPLVLGAQETELWAARPGGPVLWTSRSESMVQRVVGGDIGKGFRLYVARGRGRGLLTAPLILEEVDPHSGEKTELWRFAGGRNDVAHLSMSDVDGDGELDLALAYFESKYQVRVRSLTRAGKWIDGEAIRMATERAWADLGGDGDSDSIVGRMYGDALGEDGDLRLFTTNGVATRLEIDRGIRTLTVAKLSGDADPTLYFSDGWAARYAAEAKAQLKRVRFVAGQAQVELLGRSPDEYTFNRLEAVTISGRTGLLAWGNRELSIFWPAPSMPWQRVVVGRDPNLLAGTLLQTESGPPQMVVPGSTTRLLPLSF